MEKRSNRDKKDSLTKVSAKLDMDVICPFCGLTMYNYGNYLKCIRQDCDAYKYKWHCPTVDLIRYEGNK
jgi:hypothetical protein